MGIMVITGGWEGGWDILEGILTCYLLGTCNFFFSFSVKFYLIFTPFLFLCIQPSINKLFNSIQFSLAPSLPRSLAVAVLDRTDVLLCNTETK